MSARSVGRAGITVSVLLSPMAPCATLGGLYGLGLAWLLCLVASLAVWGLGAWR